VPYARVGILNSYPRARACVAAARDAGTPAGGFLAIRVKLVAQQGVTPASDTDWKAHRVIVALIAGAAGIAFWQTYVVPQQVQALRNEIASNAELVSKAQATQDLAQSLERQLKEARSKVASLEATNAFSVGNPYPVGLGLVRIGQPIADVEGSYPTAKIQKKERYWELENYHAAFPWVVFYFDEKEKEKKVTHVMLTRPFNTWGDGAFVHRKLSETLGTPALHPRENCTPGSCRT
jgi:hypothetical protein